MAGSPKPVEFIGMRDKFTPLESDPPSLEPDAVDGISRPGDVDQIVSSFLSELHTLTDALGSAHSKPAGGTEGVLIATEPPDPLPAQPASLKPASYRNIDVLLMDNRKSLAGKHRIREKIPERPAGGR